MSMVKVSSGEAERRTVIDTLRCGLRLLQEQTHASNPLQAGLLNAMLDPSAAMLFAQLVEAISLPIAPSLDGNERLNALLQSIETGCSCVAGIRCTAATLESFGEDPLLSLQSTRS